MAEQFPIRKSPRLHGYDYRQAGGYFVTICTHRKTCIFGAIEDGEMHLNALGTIAHGEWEDAAAHRPHIELDVFVVMPNHIHGLMWLADDLADKAVSLSNVVGAYKAGVTRQIRRELRDESFVVWQKRFYDNIIRTQKALDTIRAYVVENPQRWAEDRFYDRNDT